MYLKGRGLVIITIALFISSVTSVADNNKEPSNVICTKCECKDGLVDCQNKQLDSVFTDFDWQGVESPKVANFNSNNIRNLTEFSEIKTLQELYLSNCGITVIKKAAFKYLQSMKILDLSYNNLTTATLSPSVFEGQYMPEEYEPLRSMKILKLSHNQLHSLHQDVFEHLPELEELYLNGNPMNVLDHVTVVAISSLLFLRVLDLSSCSIKSLPEYSLHSPIHLEWLDLSSNQLKVVPDALEDAKNLKYLSLSNNPIRFIEKNSQFYKAFPVMPKLELLDMSDMPVLEAVKAEGMSGLVALRILNMTHNPALSVIDSTAMQARDSEGEGIDWPPLKEIYLSYNNLSIIENSVVGRWDLLTTIDIRENPYLCDCTTQWMVSTLAPIIRSTSPNYTSDIICKEPIEMRGRSLIYLEEIHRHMRCVDMYGARPERDGVWLIAILISVIIAVPVGMWIYLAYRRGLMAACGLSPTNSTFARTFYTKTDTEEFM